jgi:hypothetical protein
MMNFIEKLNEYVMSFEQDENNGLTKINSNASSKPAAVSEPQSAEKEKIEVAPEGYVEMVRLLAKALVMNVPPDAIDNLFSTKITGENAQTLREGLEDLINTSSNYKDNPERVENTNFLSFYNSINENNFYNKFKEIVNAMKKYSNDINM